MLITFLAGVLFLTLHNLFGNLVNYADVSMGAISFLILFELALSYGIVYAGRFVIQTFREQNTEENAGDTETTVLERKPVRNACPNCGAPLQEGAYFCRRCGAKTEPMEKAEE